MMRARIQLVLIMTLLVSFGLGVAFYKHMSLGFPFVPGEQATVWTVETHISFDADGSPAKVSLNLPEDTENLVVVGAGASAPGYGFNLEQSGPELRGIWAARNPKGEQNIYYRIRAYHGRGIPVSDAPPFDDIISTGLVSGTLANAADSLLERAWELSADPQTFAQRLIEEVTAEEPAEDVGTLLEAVEDHGGPVRLVIGLLNAAKIHARKLRGIDLTEVGRASSLHTLIEVYTGEDDGWVVLDPATGKTGLPESFLPFQRGDNSLFEVTGGKNSKISISVRSDEFAARNVALSLGQETDTGLIDFSIFALPVEAQNTFATLLLIPVGAFVVVVLRNLVGLRTSGTFMPILIALTFVQTELIAGLALFLIVVGVGLVVRSYLTALNLLLVPRIASVLIFVITLYVTLSVAGYKMGITQALSVTFFPMIIISWTIERMSVLWEEDGAKEVFVQGGGSLLTAVLAYLVMTEPHVAYLTFAFPELLYVLLAVILAIGQYTGYRLNELRRFEPLASSMERANEAAARGEAKIQADANDSKGKS